MAQNIVIGLDLDKSRFDTKMRQALKDYNIFTRNGNNAILKAKIDYSDFEDKSKLQRAFTKLKKDLDAAWRDLISSGYKNRAGKAFDFTNFSNIENQYYKLKTKQNKGTLTNETEIAMFEKLSAVMAKAAAIGTEYNRVAERRAKLNRASDNAAKEAQLRREIRALTEKDRAERRLISTQQKLSREIINSKHAGDQSISSIRRQIEYYHELAQAAAKSGHPQFAQIIRNRIKDLHKQADALERMNVLYGKQGRLLNGLSGLATRYLSIYMVADFGKKIAETTGYFQQQQVALEGILGSASKAQTVLNEIKGFAVQSPFQTKELVTFTKQLAAFGVDNNDLFPTVKKLADISAGLGVDMNRIILAYGQVKSAAVLRGQELRQFTEAGIPMVDALAKKFTELNGRLVTTGEVFKLISERKVPFEMVASVLSDMTAEGGKFYKMQENITDTMYGQIQKLRDLWTLAMEDLGKSADGPINTIIKGLQSIVKNIRPIAIALATAFAGKAIGNALTMIHRITRALKSAAAAARLFAGGLVTTIGGAIGAVAGVAIGIIWNAVHKAHALRDALKEIDDQFDKDSSKSIKGFNTLIDKLQGATAGTKAYNDALSALQSNYGDFLNDEMIESLVKQKEGWADIADAVRSAIKELQDYNNALARSEKAAELFKEKINNGPLLGLLDDYVADATKKVLYGYHGDNGEYIMGSFWRKDNNGHYYRSNDFDYMESHKDEASKYIRRSFEDMMSNGGNSLSELVDEINNQNIEDKELRRILIEHATDYFSILNRLEEWTSYEDNLLQARRSPRYLLDYTFGETKRKANKAYQGLWDNVLDSLGLDTKAHGKESRTYLAPSEAGKIYDPIKWQTNLQDSIASTAISLATNPIYNYDDSAIAAINAKWEEIKNKPIEDKLLALATALDDLASTLKDDAVLTGRINALNDAFQKDAGISTGEAKQVNERIRERIARSGEAEYKDFVLKYMASDTTYDQMVQKVIQDRQEHQDYLDKHKRDSGAHAERYDLMEEELGWLNDLFSNVYALKDKEKKGGGSGAGGGWRRLFADLFSYIKEARAEEKKLVEHSAGLTEELANQIFSGQLEGTAVNAFWSEGSPFKKFVDKMDEYGLETEVFSKDFLKGALSDIATKQIKATGTINFEDVWSQLIAVIKGRADELSKNPKMEKTVEAILTYLQQMTMEGEKIFSRDKVEKLISDQLKQMQRINANVEAIKSSRAQFERISSASNYLQAQQAVYGTSPYRHIKQSGITGSHIQRLLREGVGSGLASTDLGNNLLSLVGRSGNFNIENLGELERIRKELKKEAARIRLEDAEGETPEERQANFDNMKGVLGQFDGLVKQLIEDIIKEFEEMMKLKDPVTKGMDDIINAFRTLSDAKDAIDEGEKRGNLSDSAANRMRIQALQKMFQTVTGRQNPSFINALFGDKDSATGLSARGEKLAAWFGNPIESAVSMKYFKELNESMKKISAQWADTNYMPEITGEARVAAKNAELEGAAENASAGLSSFASSIALVGAIIQKVYEGINAGVTLAKKAIELEKAMDHRLHIQSDQNGSLVDKNGNVNIDSRYYEQEENWAKMNHMLDMISTFNQHNMDGWNYLTSGNILGAMTETIFSFADIVRDIAKFQDLEKTQEQDKLIRSNEALERALKQLDHTLQGEAGINRWSVLTQEVANLQQQKSNSETALKIENSKKNGDAEKAQELGDSITDAGNQIEDIIRGIQEEIFGTADELASKLTDPLVDAFRNGENAARAWRDAVRGYIADVLKEVLMTKVVAPQIQKVLDNFMGGATDPNEILAKFKDVSAVKDLRGQLFNLGDWLIENFESLPKEIQEMIGWNNSTSELSGGIQGITEDTARTLEGLANSILAQHVITNRYLGEMAISGFAQVQLSWFDGMLMLQKDIANNTKVVSDIMSGSRIQTAPLKVTME